MALNMYLSVCHSRPQTVEAFGVGGAEENMGSKRGFIPNSVPLSIFRADFLGYNNSIV